MMDILEMQVQRRLDKKNDRQLCIPPCARDSFMQRLLLSPFHYL